jgi:hypothetical protein
MSLTPSLVPLTEPSFVTRTTDILKLRLKRLEKSTVTCTGISEIFGRHDVPG